MTAASRSCAGSAGQTRGARQKPKLGVVVAIDETLFHCGKAIHRAQLWASEFHLDWRNLPTSGRMKAAVLGWSEAQASEADTHHAHAVRHGLY
ncbi:hypothetical protein SAMN04489708_12550 [Paracidovorax cattleyae]|uniref:Uncharacterized protein n=1 Tax=Paracidovorax cattleyae TaxID=80868 RepID=A0A1H0VF24_9BURK|nr:hypothetical protein SAMN04489708_12550 [Paracidovorax cattleyae]